MSRFFFSFSNINKEIIKKKKSLKINPKKLFLFFLKRTSFLDFEKKKLLFFFLKLQKCNFDKIYKNYLTHPIRVSDMYYQNIKNVTIDEIQFILTHNIIECNFFYKIKKYLNDEQIKKIKILTIDRNKEKKNNYLRKYYSTIYKYSKNLLIFKSLDKMDNALIGDKILFSDEALKILEKFIFPKLKKNNYNLYLYQKNLIKYAKKNILEK